VLEAFALGIAVVSTGLGVEALPEVRDGTHVLEAEDAMSFGDAVLDNRWEVIGASWRALFEDDRRASDRSLDNGT